MFFGDAGSVLGISFTGAGGVVGVGVLGINSNSTVTNLSDVSTTVHVSAVPQFAPVHDLTRHPASGAAVKITEVLGEYESEHTVFESEVAHKEIAPTLADTVPDPIVSVTRP